MSKPSNKAVATPEAPEAEAPAAPAPPPTRRVIVTDPEGIIFRDRILREGTKIEAPADVAAGWIAACRAKGEGSAVSRWPRIPAPPSTEPRPNPDWRKGPFVKVEIIAPGRYARRDCAPADVVEAEESAALRWERFGVARLLTRVSAAGAEFREALRGRPLPPPSYSRIAAKHRKRTPPPTGRVELGPPITVRARVTGIFGGGVPAVAGKLFEMPESLAAPELAAGRLALVGAPTERMTAFLSRIKAHRRQPDASPAPSY